MQKGIDDVGQIVVDGLQVFPAAHQPWGHKVDVVTRRMVGIHHWGVGELPNGRKDIP